MKTTIIQTGRNFLSTIGQDCWLVNSSNEVFTFERDKLNHTYDKSDLEAFVFSELYDREGIIIPRWVAFELSLIEPRWGEQHTGWMLKGRLLRSFYQLGTQCSFNKIFKVI